MTVLTSPYGHDMSGTTANRPTNCEPGMTYYDTTLSVLLVWSGAAWDPIGNEQSFSSVAAAGSAQGDAAALVQGFNNVTAADGAKGVRLPAAVAGLEVNGYNNSASSLLIYPATSGTINGGSANASVTVQAHTRFSFLGTSTTNFAGSYSVAGTGATLTGVETLTNKTLTTPVITTPSITGGVQVLAAAGSTQGDGGLITVTSPGLVHATGANATVGVVLPTAVAGLAITIKNQDSANAILKVWPASGDAINALSANASFSMAAKTCATFRSIDATTWFTEPLLPS